MNHDDFLDLARVTCLTNLPSDATPPGAAIVELLAKLLCAAAGGQGALELSKLRLSGQDLANVVAHPHLFALEHGLVLLPRYAGHAARVRSFFETRLGQTATTFDAALVEPAINSVLPHQVISDASGAVIFDNAHQRLAIAALLDVPVGVLTGGPGTGKTATAAALLAVRKRLQPDLLPEQILVTAPTGKAACRIGESILKAVEHLQNLSAEEMDFLKQIRSRTLHKALEWGPIPPERGGPFRRNASRPLDARLVLVDEASMVDLSLMRALVSALPEDASLLLLGDSDQLESVEVGGILAELVQRGRHAPLPDTTANCIAARLGLSPETVRGNHRSGLPSGAGPDADSTTGAQAPGVRAPLPGLVFGLQFSRRAMKARWVLDLAALVRPGTQATFEQIQSCLETHAGKLRWHRDASNQFRSQVLHAKWTEWSDAARNWAGFSPATPEVLPREALEMLSRFQLLCSTNAQVDRANTEGIRLLTPERALKLGNLPHGCPVIIQSNSHALGLTNGDVGIAIGEIHGSAAAMAVFPTAEGAPRFIPLAQLPDYKPAFGLTIHKSQGSEWSQIAIELPRQAEAALLTKNLLYTAITRSSGSIDLSGTEDVLRQIAAPA
jgi:exodeoxyribonuclease V alpha subunit